MDGEQRTLLGSGVATNNEGTAAVGEEGSGWTKEIIEGRGRRGEGEGNENRGSVIKYPLKIHTTLKEIGHI